MNKFKELDPVRVTIEGQTFTGRIVSGCSMRESYVVKIEGFTDGLGKNPEIVASVDELELIPK
jgi:hypothetical protein